MAGRIRILLALGGLVGLTLAFAPPAAAGDPCYHGYTIPATTTAATNKVSMEPCAFVPTTARVATGSTVTFANVSGENHLVTGANGKWGDRDAEIRAGQSVTVRFDQPGVYAYSCALHRGMSGVIVVGGGTADAATAASLTQEASDGPTRLAMSAFAGLAIIGWAVALLQRRRTTS